MLILESAVFVIFPLIRLIKTLHLRNSFIDIMYYLECNIGRDCLRTCNSDLKFIHRYTEQVGSLHEARIFKLSGVPNLCTENYFYENSHTLGV